MILHSSRPLQVFSFTSLHGNWTNFGGFLDSNKLGFWTVFLNSVHVFKQYREYCLDWKGSYYNYIKAFCSHFHAFQTSMSFMACKATRWYCHFSAVKNSSLFRFCSLTSDYKITMTEPLIKLDLLCNEPFCFLFFLKTPRQNCPGLLCLERKSKQPTII